MAINLANNNSLANITALPSGAGGGAMTLLATQTASGSANLSFTSGIDDTYDKYVFKFINIHPATDRYNNFTVNFSTDGGSNYNATKTTTFFSAEHNEADNDAYIAYKTADDLAQSTNPQMLTTDAGVSADADHSTNGTLTIYNPSSSVFVKHFIANTNFNHWQDYSINVFVAGYCNTTSAVNAIQFKMSSGNIDSGVIKLYGIS